MAASNTICSGNRNTPIATTEITEKQVTSNSVEAPVFFAALSADGRYVAFSSDASNLVPDDTNAVRVEWQGEKLGYVPRRENAHVARQMDHGAVIKARIVKLLEHRNPWQRMQFEVYVEL